MFMCFAFVSLVFNLINSKQLVGRKKRKFVQKGIYYNQADWIDPI